MSGYQSTNLRILKVLETFLAAFQGRGKGTKPPWAASKSCYAFQKHLSNLVYKFVRLLTVPFPWIVIHGFKTLENHWS